MKTTHDLVNGYHGRKLMVPDEDSESIDAICRWCSEHLKGPWYAVRTYINTQVVNGSNIRDHINGVLEEKPEAIEDRFTGWVFVIEDEDEAVQFRLTWS